MLKKAVIYARYSCDKQSEQSIEGQIRVINEFAEREGYKIVGEYIDRARSAKTDNRPQFLQMINDSAKHVFSFVLVYKLDRFSRNRYDSAIYKNKLKKNGVKVISATENLSDNPESIITEAMLEAMAEFYSAELAQKTSRGMRESALKCQTTGSLPPLGYKWGDDKKLTIDDNTADIPRIVFKMYAEHKGKKVIADELNRRGYRTRRGRLFNHKSFDNMLTNKKYIGIYAYGDEIEIEGGCPQLIDRDLFDDVQKIVEQTKKAPAAARATVEYYLSGKLYCGYCGDKMTAVGGTSRNGEQHYYYRCKSHKDCYKKSERKGFIEWFVAEQVLALANMPEHKTQLAQKIISAYETAMSTSDIKELERKLDAVNAKLNSIVDMLLERKSDVLLSKMDALELQKSEIEEELIAARISANHIPSVDEIKDWLTRLARLDPADDKTQEFVLRAFVNKVYLWDDKAVIVLNLANTEGTVTFEQIREWEEMEKPLPDNAESGLFNSEFGSPNTDLNEHTAIIGMCFCLIKKIASP